LRAAALLDPSLSTITQPAFEIGMQSAELLFEIIKQTELKNYSEVITINSQLFIRDSTKKQSIGKRVVLS